MDRAALELLSPDRAAAEGAALGQLACELPGRRAADHRLAAGRVRRAGGDPARPGALPARLHAPGGDARALPARAVRGRGRVAHQRGDLGRLSGPEGPGADRARRALRERPAGLDPRALVHRAGRPGHALRGQGGDPADLRTDRSISGAARTGRFKLARRRSNLVTQVTVNPAARTARQCSRTSVSRGSSPSSCCSRCSASRTSRARRSSTRRTPPRAPAACSRTRALAVEVERVRARGAEGARPDRAVRRQQGRQVRRRAERAARAHRRPARRRCRGSRRPGGAVAGKLAAALEPLAKLGEHRSAVDALSLPGAEATGYYTQVNAALLDVVSAVADASREPALTRAVEAYASYLRAKEQTGLERAALAKGFTAGTLPGRRRAPPSS